MNREYFHINIRIIHAHDFIKLAPEGQLDLEESRKLIMEIATASETLVDYEIIVDTRKAQPVMSVAELWLLAVELSKFRKVFSRKTAVLCPIEEFDLAAFFACCAKNKGCNISPFTSFEDAVNWLTANGR